MSDAVELVNEEQGGKQNVEDQRVTEQQAEELHVKELQEKELQAWELHAKVQQAKELQAMELHAKEQQEKEREEKEQKLSEQRGEEERQIAVQATGEAFAKIHVYDRHVKCIVMGDSTIGKSSMIQRFNCGKYLVGTYQATTFQLFEKLIFVDNARVHLTVWDTAADETMENPFIYYREADIIVLCFAIDDPDSYRNITSVWCKDFNQARPNAPILLVGLKSDVRHLPFQKCITRAKAFQLAARINAAEYRECSAMFGHGIHEVFEEAARIATNPPAPVLENDDCCSCCCLM